MVMKETWNRKRAVLGLAVFLAGCLPAMSAMPARACDKDKREKDKKGLTLTADNLYVTSRLVGDKRADKKLAERIGRLEARLEELSRQLESLADSLAGGPPRRGRRRDGRSEPPMPMPGPEAFGFMPAPRVPPAPPALGFEFAPERLREALEDQHGRLRELQEEWRERQAEWQEEWREHQAEWQEEWRERQTEMVDHWREQVNEWRERQHQTAESWRAQEHEMQVQIEELARRQADKVRRQVERALRQAERAEERQRAQTGRSRARSRGRSGIGSDSGNDAERLIYEVTGEHADRLYDLLAPSNVRVIVSREGKNVAVRGTEEEHDVLRAFLELLNWVDRTEVFEHLIQGERTSRTYDVGPKRAQMLWDMLAPDDVKVVVSHEGDDAVSVRGTDREHEVLSDALKLLRWMD